MPHRNSCLLLIACALTLGWVRVGHSADSKPAPDEDDQLDQVVVTATRTPTLIRNEPLRVEAVPTEEIEENLTVQPGNISTLMNELPGVRVQSTASGLAGAALKLRGLPGRQALVLTDGLPLLGAAPDAFGILQTPPLDLARVEVIKGAASALYGGSALAGVLNLVSRGSDAAPQLLANLTSRGGRDLAAFLTEKASPVWSGTLSASAHDQSRDDINGDGWADEPAVRRYTVQPRVWWNGGGGRSLFLTAGLVDEDRDGGTMPGQTLPDGGTYPERLYTRRLDGGAVSQLPLGNDEVLTGRFSTTSARQDQTFGTQREAFTETTVFAEEAWSGAQQGHRWVLGLAFEQDHLDAAMIPGVSYMYNVPALFAQDEFSPWKWLTLAGSARVDANNDYGTFVSPRFSMLLRAPESDWSVRASLGGGFSAPTPFLDEVESAGLGSLLPLRGLHAERARTASLDLKWADDGWDLNASVFRSDISDPLQVLPATGNKLELVNAPGPLRVPGMEALMGYTAGPLELLASWSYLDVTQPTPATGVGGRENAPLVPRNSGELAGILESEKRGRIGLELGYTGPQALEYDPYRSTTPAYLELNALAEIRFGKTAVFLNAINLTNVRQTHYDPLLRPSPGPGGNPITEVWAPLEGRTFNIGLRTEL